MYSLHSPSLSEHFLPYLFWFLLPYLSNYFSMESHDLFFVNKHNNWRRKIFIDNSSKPWNNWKLFYWKLRHLAGIHMLLSVNREYFFVLLCMIKSYLQYFFHIYIYIIKISVMKNSFVSLDIVQGMSLQYKVCMFVHSANGW